jgi:tetratricopeptide (TPR) repeat protein
MFFNELLEHAFAPGEHYRRLAQEARTHFDNQNYDDSINLATRLIFLYPDYDRGYIVRACAYHAKRDFDAAIADYSKALNCKHIDDRALIYYNRAAAYQGKRAFDEVIIDMADAVRLGLDRDDAITALMVRGDLLMAKGDLQRAESNFTKLLEIAPEQSEWVNGRLGFIKLEASAYEDAVHYFTEIIVANPANAYAYANRSYAYIKLHKLEQALVDIEEALRLTPDEPYAYNNRGVIRFQTGDNQGAEADYRRTLEIDPDFPNSYVGLGCLAFIREEYQTALEHFQKASEPKPNKRSSDTAVAGIAIAHHALGQVDEALKLWRGLVEADSHFQEADWLEKEYGWTAPLIETAAKIISAL